jgi:hypothetical protein
MHKATYNKAHSIPLPIPYPNSSLETNSSPDRPVDSRGHWTSRYRPHGSSLHCRLYRMVHGLMPRSRRVCSMGLLCLLMVLYRYCR